MSFESLNLRAPLLENIRKQGYTDPTPVQLAAIPHVLGGRDVMASARTGTGKTAAFTLPMIQRLIDNQPENRQGKIKVRALILTPTRELAAQVGQSIRTYAQGLPIRSTEIFGGVGMGNQLNALSRGVDILVATPGRLMDHMQRGTVKLDEVEFLVLDEADRMLDMGFIKPIERIVAALPGKRQTLMFSATFNKDIRKLAQRFLDNPESVDTSPANATAQDVEQIAYLVDTSRKREMLSHLIGVRRWDQVLVFTRTKHGANRLVKQLDKDGIDAMAIHGNKSQGARTKALDAFKKRKVRALIATDVAARGLDIQRLPIVVNYDMPGSAEDYVHRIGRTGRAGEEGIAVSMVSADERSTLRDIEKLTGNSLKGEVLEGYTPTETASAGAPPRKNSRGGRRGGNPGGNPAAKRRGGGQQGRGRRG